MYVCVAVCGCLYICMHVRVCPVPFLSVLPHTHSSSVARGGVAAGPLPDLEANATAGATGDPQSPGAPHTVPMETPQNTRLHTHKVRGVDKYRTLAIQ